MIIHIDYSTGASGDKTLGALLELAEVLGLTTFAELQALIAQLLPDAAVCLHREKVVRGSVNASYLSVAEDAPPWRRWSQIRTLLEDAGASGLLGERTAARALTVFEAIAVAEAEVHGVELEQVHFHEIGAADSVVDIVGCCWLLERLAPSAVLATPLALGSGTVSFSHGTLPVPAPATARLVTGLPVCTGPLICGSSDADRDREGEGGAVGGHRDAGGHRDGSSV
ncbi:MAG: DUF111 family protein, partial [Coriobacteriales bacterium]|nr:DUF111 family protein [Coriobacteriales bacterium]